MSVSKFVVPGAAQLVAQFMVLPFGSILLLPNFPTAQFSVAHFPVAIISYINSVLPCFPTLLFFVDDFSRCPIFRLPFLSLPFLQLPFLPWIVQTWHHPQNWEHIASEEDWAMARSSSHQNVWKFRHFFLSYLVEVNILVQNSSKTTTSDLCSCNLTPSYKNTDLKWSRKRIQLSPEVIVQFHRLNPKDQH